MSALELALQRAGFDVSVEERAGLALLIPRQLHQVATQQQRRAIVALAAEHGFTHVALELLD
jgi:hypothetical protein